VHHDTADAHRHLRSHGPEPAERSARADAASIDGETVVAPDFDQVANACVEQRARVAVRHGSRRHQPAPYRHVRLPAVDRDADHAAGGGLVDQVERMLRRHELVGRGFQHRRGRAADALFIDTRLDLVVDIAAMATDLVHGIGRRSHGDLAETFQKLIQFHVPTIG
jgi:hypothetical protein